MTRIIRPKEAAEILGISIPTLYRRLEDPEFPPRVRIGPQAVGFRKEDLEKYISDNVEKKDTEVA